MKKIQTQKKDENKLNKPKLKHTNKRARKRHVVKTQVKNQTS